MSVFADIEAFIESKVWPFLKNLGKKVVNDEINALQPIAAGLVSAAQKAVVDAAASGSTGNLGAVLGKLVTDTANEAESMAITAGASSILASIGTALATNPTTAPALAVAPKPAP